MFDRPPRVLSYRIFRLDGFKGNSNRVMLAALNAVTLAVSTSDFRPASAVALVPARRGHAFRLDRGEEHVERDGGFDRGARRGRGGSGETRSSGRDHRDRARSASNNRARIEARPISIDRGQARVALPRETGDARVNLGKRARVFQRERPVESRRARGLPRAGRLRRAGRGGRASIPGNRKRSLRGRG